MNIIDRMNNKLKYTVGEQLKPGIFYTCIIESLYQCIMEDVKQLVDNMSTTENVKNELKTWFKEAAKDGNLADELIKERKGEE